MTTSWNGQAEGHQRTLETETAATARAPQLSGQRREDSVLFSLSDLQALGSRAVANASIGTLPTTNALAGSFAAPLLIPITPSTRRPAWVLPALAGGGLLTLALAFTLALVLVGDVRPPAPQVSVSNRADTRPTTTQRPATQRPATQRPPTRVAMTGTAVSPAVDKVAPAASTKKKVAHTTTHRRTRRHRTRRPHARRHRSTRKTLDKAQLAARPTIDKPSRNELDILLDGALKTRGRGEAHKVSAPTERTPAGRELPERLERRQIVAGMQAIRGPVRACFDRFRVPGMALLRVTIGAHGRVSKTKVSGLFAGTPTGACVRRAVQSARFPQAKNATTISYPFQR